MLNFKLWLIAAIFFFTVYIYIDVIHSSMNSLMESLGPKGVINDWRKFKLESMDQEALPPNKRELLRQMSSPHKPRDSCVGGYNRKVDSFDHDFKIKNELFEEKQCFSKLGCKKCILKIDSSLCIILLWSNKHQTILKYCYCVSHFN